MRFWLALAAINGFLAVAAGAFAAHGLKSRLSADALTTFEVGVRYHMYHAIAILAVAWLAGSHPKSTVVFAAGWSFFIGILLFSGSLYALSLSSVRWLGAITPFGGGAFLTGWGLIALHAIVYSGRAAPE